MMRRNPWLVVCACACALTARSAPADFGVDAPQLAAPGPWAVGYETLRLVDPAQPDVLAYDPARHEAPLRDRPLLVDLWYPATVRAGAARVVYSGTLPSERESPVAFEVAGNAVRGAAAAGRDWPLVVLSHGYSNHPAALAWLTENIASKGYVVAAIHHEDPPITDRSRFAGPLLRRALDIAFVARSLESSLGAAHRIDPARVALLGYSMGGYGVLTAGGAALDPVGPAARMVPGGLLVPYARDGARRNELAVPGLRAVVALAPAGGGALAAWGAAGLAQLTAPLLLIQGDHDRTVDYATGAHAVFEQARHADRYLLTLHGAGHAIGLGPAPPTMRATLWDLSWFEDPVWRKSRIMAIEAHFITAFLDRYLKDDAQRGAYLDVAVAEADEGRWPADAAPTDYGAYSPGGPVITVWKGFQRSQATGLRLDHAAPAGDAAP